jgi:NAD(P)-dependent dehydrogenase (short-subunit alcohol dehydrogenase family)
VSGRSRFDGRVALVTGAARGIGRAIATAFVAEGARVAAADVLEDRLEALRDESGGAIEVFPVDLADGTQAAALVGRVLERLGGLDVLVNCAALQPDGPALDVTPAELEATFAVNVRAPFVLMQEACRHFVASGGGAIVNIASANAIRNESPESIYNASKAALVALTRAFAHELGHLGIRVNAVCPGETVTAEAAEEMTAAERSVVHEYLRRIPMRRAGRPEEQAAAVLFLASEEASFITGETLLVDGGELSGDWYDTREAPPVPPPVPPPIPPAVVP